MEFLPCFGPFTAILGNGFRLDIFFGSYQCRSILGPLLYLLYTNDLPEVVHEQHIEEDEQSHQHSFNVSCQSCGEICLYADDSTLTLSSKNVQELTVKIAQKYSVISEYMASNRLILNSDKTHLMVMTSARMHSVHQDFGIYLDTGSETILPQNEERLLGAIVSNDLSWNSHVRDSKNSLISTLTSRVNALSKMCQFSNFQVRKMVANGIVMSYLSYLMPVYGGCPEYLLDALQTLQNRAARLVTNSSWYTSSATMLHQVGWLSVRQMVAYYSLIFLFKTKQNTVPFYIHNKISAHFNVQTRLSESNGIKEIRKMKTRLGLQSFLPRTICQWNSLPHDVRMISDLKKFKFKVKQWVKQQF